MTIAGFQCQCVTLGYVLLGITTQQRFCMHDGSGCQRMEKKLGNGGLGKEGGWQGKGMPQARDEQCNLIIIAVDEHAELG